MPEQPRNYWQALVHPSRGQLTVGVVLAVTALLVVWTLRTQAAQPDYSNLRRTELVQLLDNVTAETRRLEAEARELTTTRDELVSGAAGVRAADDETRSRIETLQILAGTVAAHGPGVRITINDPAQAVTPELLLDALEELRDAGAEVIEFNDTVRVVAASWVGLSPDGKLSVDGVEIDRPIVIEAIGDPATLEAGARFRGGLVSEVEGSRVQGSVEITQSDTVSIESLATLHDPQFAEPK